MDVSSYCEMISNQLTGWKASIYDIILAAEKLGQEDKRVVQPMIRSLNRIVEELNRNIADLKAQCPSEWSPRKQEIDSGMVDLKQNFEQLSERLQSLLPESTAWV